MSSKWECVMMSKFGKPEGRQLLGVWKAWVMMGGKAIGTWEGYQWVRMRIGYCEKDKQEILQKLDGIMYAKIWVLNRTQIKNETQSAITTILSTIHLQLNHVDFLQRLVFHGLNHQLIGINPKDLTNIFSTGSIHPMRLEQAGRFLTLTALDRTQMAQPWNISHLYLKAFVNAFQVILCSSVINIPHCRFIFSWIRRKCLHLC